MVSMTQLIAIIVVAILASSAVAAGISIMIPGPEGPEGPQGEQGPPWVYNVTHALGVDSTTSTTFVDMPDMSVDINVTDPSLLLITFSGQARVSVVDSPVYI